MISSSHNPKIRLVKSLLAQRRERYAQNAFVLEGVRLVEEALAAGLTPRLLLYSPQVSARGQALVAAARVQGAESEEIEPRLMDQISATETSQGLLGVFPLQPLPIPAAYDFVLILDGLRDPGNLGAILRTAAAAGVHLVLLTPGAADPYAPKVLRAGMGAHFRLPIHPADWDTIRTLTQQREPPLKLILADAARGEPCWQSDLTTPLALVIGGEAEGASPQAYAMADTLIHIPMQGTVESLNASIAASILLYEITRQRQT